MKKTKSLINYQNEWVAVDKSDNSVVEHNKKLEKLIDQIKDKAEKVTLFKVPPVDSVLAS